MDSNLNILSLYYFVVLAKELHMTHAAKNSILLSRILVSISKNSKHTTALNSLFESLKWR